MSEMQAEAALDAADGSDTPAGEPDPDAPEISVSDLESADDAAIEVAAED